MSFGAAENDREVESRESRKIYKLKNLKKK